MKKTALFVLFCFLGLIAASCMVSHPLTAPPAPRSEVRPASPGAHHIWIAGHWKWTGSRYVWVSGHWVKNRSGKVWVRGHWVQRGPRWVWIPGRWK